jgi:O-antigen/teichoic acid export membrane protein
VTASDEKLGAGESRGLARGGLVSFVGSAVSAVMGFVLTIVLARTLGDTGSGIVLQAIAVFTIVLSFARAGMDSAAVWIMPRLVGHDPAKVRSALGFMFVATAISGTVCAIGVALASPAFGASGGADGQDVAEAVAIAGWFLPFGALALVALAATRGLGGVVPYVGVGSIALPTVRPVAVLLVAIAGGSYAAVTLAWSLPLPATLIAAVLVLRFQVRRSEARAEVRGRWRATPELRKQILAYALPRTLSAGLEQSLIWFDVVFVGILLGSASAGIYGGASRFVAAGLVIDSALRVVVSPRFSSLLFLGKIDQLESLYRTAATWLVLFGTPVYLILGIFAPVVLRILGPGFDTGSSALAILCAGAILTFAAGNVHSVLLMSGRSGWGAFNKAIVLAINVVGNLVLVPVIGINGAAISWAASMLVDAALASVEVRRFVGVRLSFRTVGYALLVAILSVALPSIAVRLLLGENLAGLVTATAVSIVVFFSWCILDKRRLRLGDLHLAGAR